MRMFADIYTGEVATWAEWAQPGKDTVWSQIKEVVSDGVGGWTFPEDLEDA